MLHPILLGLLFVVPAVVTLVAAVILAEGENGSVFKRGFMAFWYKWVRQLNILWPSIQVGDKRLVISPEVYKPLENEHAIVDYLNKGDRVLDLGCGSGVGAVFAAAKASEVVAVDISGAAVRNTQENCKLHGLKNVKALQSDMFSNVEGKFDLILANPPYINLDFKDETEQFATSVRYLPTMFAQAGQHLTPEGRLLVQFPIWFRGKLEKLGDKHGFDLVSVRRTPLKSVSLFLLSLAYMQVGWRSAFFVFRPKLEVGVVEQTAAKAEPVKRSRRAKSVPA